MSSTELEIDVDAEQDLRDVFKLMYDDEDDWEVEEVRLNLRRVTITDSRMIIHL
jgi:2-phospho-L-lactate guanylyltransferase (CobY/MobA/RfbA family)